MYVPIVDGVIVIKEDFMDETTNVFEELEKLGPGFEGIGVLSAVLDMPDKEFKSFAPIILSELEKELNNSNSAFFSALSFEKSGKTFDELDELIAQLQLAISDSAKNYSEEKQGFVTQILTMIKNSIEKSKGKRNRFIEIPIELCDEDAVIPTYARVGDAGLDVCSIEDVLLMPGETKIIRTGLKCAIPSGYELQVRPRSGKSAKTKIRIANAPGTIDSGYRDEIGIIVENIEPEIKKIDYIMNENGQYTITNIIKGSPAAIGKGEKIAQLVLQEIPAAAFVKVESVSGIGENRGGGFGHTGE